jgi:hypothetical protein
MSTYNLYGYNYLVVPRLDFYMKFESGKSIFISEKYTKWLAIFCLLSGIKVSYSLTKYIYSCIKKLYNKNNLLLGNNVIHEANSSNKFVLIITNGENKFVNSIIKLFSYKKYNILIINEAKEFNFKNHSEHLQTALIEIIFDEFSAEKLAEIISNFNERIIINFIFDLSYIKSCEKSQNEELIFKSQLYIFNNKFILEKFSLLNKIYENIKFFLNDANVFNIISLENELTQDNKFYQEIKYSYLCNLYEILNENLKNFKTIKIKSTKEKIKEEDLIAE